MYPSECLPVSPLALFSDVTYRPHQWQARRPQALALLTPHVAIPDL